MKTKKNREVTRVDFKLYHDVDADIIEFLQRDSRTNIGIFREAVRLLMSVEDGRQLLDEAAIVQVIKNTVNEELLGGVIRNVLSEYELAKKRQDTKPRKALGFQAKQL